MNGWQLLTGRMGKSNCSMSCYRQSWRSLSKSEGFVRHYSDGACCPATIHCRRVLDEIHVDGLCGGGGLAAVDERRERTLAGSLPGVHGGHDEGWGAEGQQGALSDVGGDYGAGDEWQDPGVGWSLCRFEGAVGRFSYH